MPSRGLTESQRGLSKSLKVLLLGFLHANLFVCTSSNYSSLNIHLLALWLVIATFCQRRLLIVLLLMLHIKSNCHFLQVRIFYILFLSKITSILSWKYFHYMCNLYSLRSLVSFGHEWKLILHLSPWPISWHRICVKSFCTNHSYMYSISYIF